MGKMMRLPLLILGVQLVLQQGPSHASATDKELLNFESVDPITCKVSCLEKGGNFCATSDFNKGKCCSLENTQLS